MTTRSSRFSVCEFSSNLRYFIFIKHLFHFFSCFLSSVLLGQDQNSTLSDEELSQMLFGTNPSENVEFTETKKAPWVPSYSGEIGIGYSDNPLYGPFVRQDTSFLETSLEAFFIREGSQEYLSYLYLFGEGKRYDALEDNKETSLLLAQLEHAYTPLKSPYTYGLRVRHIYYDQGFDFSELGLPYTMNVRSNKTEWAPYLSKVFSEQWSGSIQFIKGFEDFKVIADDNQDAAVQISIRGTPDFLEWEFEGQYSKKQYRERPKRDGDGNQLSTDAMQTEKVELSYELQKDFSHSLWKNSSAKLKWTRLKDDAGGYYDFEKIGFRLEQELQVSFFSTNASIMGSETVYKHRRVDSGDRFKRQSLSYSTSATFPFHEKTDFYIRWEREEDFSNARDYEYFTNFWSLGVQWEL